MKENFKKIKIAVLGLGNYLLCDDGAGVHAIRMLQHLRLDGVTFVEVGTAALHAQHILVESDHVIAIDAVHYDGSPGEIYTFDGQEEKADSVYSLHDLGIIGAVNLLPLELRPIVHIIGIEPKIIDYGMELSDIVKASLPKVIEIVKQTIQKIKEEKLTNSRISNVRS